MAGEWFSLTRSQALNKVRANIDLHRQLMETMRTLPDRSGGFIADRDWKLGDKKPWVIKLNTKNYEYVTKKSQYWSKAGGKYDKSQKLYTVSWPGTPNPIQIRWRKSGTIAASKAATKEQELGSAFIFRRVLNDDAKWKDVGELQNDPKTYPELVKIWGGDVDDDWLHSYLAQSRVMFEEFQPHKFKEYNRDGGFMAYISGLVKRKFRISKKDTWNPADIWIIKGDSRTLERQIDDSMEGPGQTIHELNAILRTKFKKRELLGISLKKTGKVAHYEEINMDGIIIDTKDYNYPVNYKDFISNFDIKENTGSFVQDVKLAVNAPKENKDFSFQIKANSPEKTGGGNLKFEATMKGAGSARLGKAPVNQLQMILHRMKSYKAGETGFKNNYKDKMYPATADEFNADLPVWKKKITYLIENKKITTDTKDIDKIMVNIAKSYASPADKKGTNTRCKLMGLQFFYCLAHLSEDDLREFVTDMVFISQKKATLKADKFGPFGKVY
tara:strand:+ start:53 stop:1552 length:1500 start_codon:yes stop_codon:yes gene_type:complete